MVTVVKGDPIGLKHTLDSVCSQSANPDSWEVVVIDGSIPHLETVARTVPSDQLVYSWEPPTGIYPAMNKAVSVARGDYVLFLNAGDTFCDDHVVENVLTSIVATSPAWLFGRVLFTSEAGQELIEPDWDYEGEASKLFARGLFPSHQGTIMRRDLIESLGGFDTSFAITADYHLMLKAHRMARPVVLNFTIARFQQGGLSSVSWKQAIKEFHRARIQVFQPTGFDRLRELAETGNQFTRQALVRVVRRSSRG